MILIESVDGKSIEGLSATEAVLKIRGRKRNKSSSRPFQEREKLNRFRLPLLEIPFQLKRYMLKCLMMELRKFK